MNKIFTTVIILVTLFTANQVVAGPFNTDRHGSAIASIPHGSGLPIDTTINWLVGKTICFKYESNDLTAMGCFAVLEVQLRFTPVISELWIKGGNDENYVFTTVHSPKSTSWTSTLWKKNIEVISIE